MHVKKKIGQISCLALLCAVQLLCVAQGRAQQSASNFDEYISREVKTGRFSGAILIARDGKVLISKGYGLANVADDVPNTAQTRFRIGSLTKQFTAMAILILQERQALNVQDSICKYLPRCPEAWQPLTIHHLLTHTSGLPDYMYTVNLTEDERAYLPVTRDIDRLRNSPLEFTPGTKFSYCNSGYVLLGHIIEKVTGESYGDFVRKNIFEPLKMVNTGYDYNGLILKRRAVGYTLRGETLITAPFVDMSVPFAAGGLYSTVEDLYLWDQALYTERLVSKKSLDLMFTPFKQHYGYGWYIDEQFKRLCISHGGRIEGYMASVARFPAEKLTIIVMSNLDSTSTDRIARNLAAISFGLSPSRSPERQEIQVDPKIYEPYLGQYELSSNLILTVARKENRLLAQAIGYPAVELFPESEIEFFAKEMDAQILFVGDERGNITHALISLNGHKIQARKIK
jgi:CubicO group peptidase (beta-lactamase class C family)